MTKGYFEKGTLKLYRDWSLLKSITNTEINVQIFSLMAKEPQELSIY